MPIFELSQPGRTAAAQLSADNATPADPPEQFRRKTSIGLPEVSKFAWRGHAPGLHTHASVPVSA